MLVRSSKREQLQIIPCVVWLIAYAFLCGNSIRLFRLEHGQALELNFRDNTVTDCARIIMIVAINAILRAYFWTIKNW